MVLCPPSLVFLAQFSPPFSDLFPAPLCFCISPLPVCRPTDRGTEAAWRRSRKKPLPGGQPDTWRRGCLGVSTREEGPRGVALLQPQCAAPALGKGPSSSPPARLPACLALRAQPASTLRLSLPCPSRLAIPASVGRPALPALPLSSRSRRARSCLWLRLRPGRQSSARSGALAAALLTALRCTRLQLLPRPPLDRLRGWPCFPCCFLSPCCGRGGAAGAAAWPSRAKVSPAWLPPPPRSVRRLSLPGQLGRLCAPSGPAPRPMNGVAFCLVGIPPPRNPEVNGDGGERGRCCCCSWWW